MTYWFQDSGQVLVAVMEIRNNWFLDEARARMAKRETQSERLREFLEMSAADHEATFWIELWRLSSRDDSARLARQAMADAIRRTLGGNHPGRSANGGVRSRFAGQGGAGPGRAHLRVLGQRDAR